MSVPPMAELSSLRLFAQLWPFVRPYQLRLLAALLALLLTTLMSVLLGQGVRLVIDLGLVEGSVTGLNQAALALVALIVVLALGTFARFYWVTSLGELVSRDLRSQAFARLVQLHPSYFDAHRSGEIMSRLTTDTTLLQSIMGSSASMALRSALTVLAGLVMLLVTSPSLTLVVVVAVPVVLLPIFTLGRRVRQLSKRSQETIADVGTYAGEIIAQIKTVQAYDQQQAEQQAFDQETEKAWQVARLRIWQRSLLIALAMLLSFLAVGTMVYLGALAVMRGDMSPGDLAAFVFYALMVAFGAATVSEVFGELQRGAGALERILQLLQAESEIQSPAQPQTPLLSEAPLVALEQVVFSYPSRPEQYALAGINLRIQAKQRVAIVGPSGAGKSTLFELLLRFYDPTSGQVLWQGLPLPSLDLSHYRRRLAWVAQNPVLFARDVHYNIAYGSPHASLAEVEAAAKAAHAWEFIQELPQGLNTYLGEQGVRLSGGQKQRLVIARAILNNPELLLLDEATSALDSQSEHWVQQALNQLMQNRTTLIIAHRLATVIDADLILVMDKGQIVAQGSHPQLLQSSPLYRQLAEQQFGAGGNKASAPAAAGSLKD